MARQILGRYELTHELGRGSMGVVWAATDLRESRAAAVKLLAPPTWGSDPVSLEKRFLREARITGRLRHPGIPVVYDHGRVDGELYLVMERVPGRTLAAVLKEQGPFPVERAVRIARGIADALAYAHGEDVVHRDLKPSNLMLTPDDEVKILDFGIAAALEPHAGETRFTASHAAPGTAVYMAPEQAEGKAEPASDLYSLGCVLYELLAGQPPFTDGSVFMIYLQHSTAPVPPLTEHRPDVPEDLAELVVRLLAKKPADRPATAADVRDLLGVWAPAADTGAVPSPDPRLAALDALRRDGQPGRALEGFQDLAADPAVGRRDLLAARVGAARCAGALGRTSDALGELKSVLAEQRSVLGAGDPAVLDTRFEIAVLLVRTGERHRAKELLSRLVDDEESVLAPDDPRRGRSRVMAERLGRMA